MINCLISAVTSAVLTVLGIIYLRRYFKEKESELTVGQFRIMLIAAPIAMAAYSVFFTLFSGYALIEVIKNVTLISGLLIAAISDIRLKLIPNMIPLSMAVLCIMQSAIKWFFYPVDLDLEIIAMLLGALLGGGLLFIGRLISKNGMGMGDIKLMLAAGLFVKFDGMFGLLFWALLLSLIFGIVLIIMKKAKAKTTIFMAPFFLLGAVISNVLLIISYL